MSEYSQRIGEVTVGGLSETLFSRVQILMHTFFLEILPGFTGVGR
jgi:hypothetical protein